MKQLFLTYIMTALLFQTVYAQDLVVTAQGDSLNCKITKIKNGYVHFTFRYENEIRNTLLPTDQIRTYQKNYFTQADVRADEIKNVNGDYQKVRIGISGGWSRRTARISEDIPSNLQQHYKDLMSGYHFMGDFTYFTSENIGLGVRYSRFRSGNEAQLRNSYTNVKDDITIQYIGPTLVSRMSSADKKSHFISALSFGYLAYKDQAFVQQPFTISSGTLGMVGSLGGDFAISNNLALGLEFSYTLGSFSEYQLDRGWQTQTVKLEGEKENISRIDISVGLRWNK